MAQKIDKPDGYTWKTYAIHLINSRKTYEDEINTRDKGIINMAIIDTERNVSDILAAVNNISSILPKMADILIEQDKRLNHIENRIRTIKKKK